MTHKPNPDDYDLSSPEECIEYGAAVEKASIIDWLMAQEQREWGDPIVVWGAYFARELQQLIR